MSDKIIKGLAYDGRVSIIAIDSTNICEEARKIHGLSPVCTAAWTFVNNNCFNWMSNEIKR